MFAVLTMTVLAMVSFNILWIRFTVVVFPFVHVTPMTKKFLDG